MPPAAPADRVIVPEAFVDWKFAAAVPPAPPVAPDAPAPGAPTNTWVVDVCVAWRVIPLTVPAPDPVEGT
ncbi:hypothetical protein ACFPRL_23280 [Pseudoclavibacter helvolus]